MLHVYLLCVHSQTREVTVVRGHLVEVASPFTVWDLGCQDGLYPLVLGVRFLPLCSHHLGTHLPSQQMCVCVLGGAQRGFCCCWRGTSQASILSGFSFSVLGIEPRSSQLLGRHATTELHTSYKLLRTLDPGLTPRFTAY